MYSRSTSSNYKYHIYYLNKYNNNNYLHNNNYFLLSITRLKFFLHIMFDNLFVQTEFILNKRIEIVSNRANGKKFQEILSSAFASYQTSEATNEVTS